MPHRYVSIFALSCCLASPERPCRADLFIISIAAIEAACFAHSAAYAFGIISSRRDMKAGLLKPATIEVPRVPVGADSLISDAALIFIAQAGRRMQLLRQNDGR